MVKIVLSEAATGGVLYKNVFLKFAKFTGKHLCQSLFFNKVAGLRPATLLKKRLWHRCFPVNFATFLRTPIFIEHLWWLLLKYPIKVFACRPSLIFIMQLSQNQIPMFPPTLIFALPLIFFLKRRERKDQ